MNYISERHELVTLMDDGLTAVEIAAIMNKSVKDVHTLMDEENTWMLPLDDDEFYNYS